MAKITGSLLAFPSYFSYIEYLYDWKIMFSANSNPTKLLFSFTLN